MDLTEREQFFNICVPPWIRWVTNWKILASFIKYRTHRRIEIPSYELLFAPSFMDYKSTNRIFCCLKHIPRVRNYTHMRARG